MIKNCGKCGVSIQVQPLYKVCDKDEPLVFWCEPCIKQHEPELHKNERKEIGDIMDIVNDVFY